MKRVITGHDGSGKSVFVSHGEPQRVIDVGGFGLVEIWATDAPVALPDAAVDPELAQESFLPSSDGTRFRLFSIDPVDPDATMVSDEAFREQLETIKELVPGLGHTLESDHPGMHTTDTIDYVVVLSGEADLELDDGATVSLVSGDCVVQRGTRHAWRNTGKVPFVAAAVMVGGIRGDRSS
jgi:mannose-6-phosphate isomerase-like protein (cupin superfamily)